MTDKRELTLQYAAENRRAEISLLWTRSSFFWAFLAVAIASYGGAIHTQHRTLGLLVACFAAICSLCWTLANRAGKYWQEVWEIKTEGVAEPVLEPNIFPRRGNPAVEEGWFLKAKQYSPSRLAIAISDMTFLLWFIIAIGTGIADFFPASAVWFVYTVRILALVGMLLIGVSILIWCRSGVDIPTTWSEALSILRATLCSFRLPTPSNRETQSDDDN